MQAITYFYDIFVHFLNEIIVETKLTPQQSSSSACSGVKEGEFGDMRSQNESSPMFENRIDYFFNKNVIFIDEKKAKNKQAR